VLYLHRDTAATPFQLQSAGDGLAARLASGELQQCAREGGWEGVGGVFVSEATRADRVGACLVKLRHADTAAEVANRAATHEAAIVSERLLRVPFTTLPSYLHLLREAALAAGAAGPSALLVLSAAVSDFYVPTAAMAHHKIQSAGGSSGLDLHLEPVPKCLGLLKAEWCPRACVVSFKLETDPAILLKKAHGAVDRYGMDAVVANLLHTRYDEVTIVSAQHHDAGSRVAARSATLPPSEWPRVAVAHPGVVAEIAGTASFPHALAARHVDLLTLRRAAGSSAPSDLEDAIAAALVRVHAQHASSRGER
jgi:hypothetical protein